MWRTLYGVVPVCALSRGGASSCRSRTRTHAGVLRMYATSSGCCVTGTDSRGGEMHDCQGTRSRTHRPAYCPQRGETPALGFLVSAVRSCSNRVKAF